MRSFITIIAILICAPVYSQNDSTALILVDIQEFYFPGGFSELVRPEEAAQKSRQVLEFFREQNMPVIHIKHATKKDSLIAAAVKPIAGETIITKQYANSFKETELNDVLKTMGIAQVVIVGMMTHMCVEATARQAADLGFGVIVLSDACATKDLAFDGDTVLAPQVHLSTLSSIHGYYGKVMKVDELIEYFKP